MPITLQIYSSFSGKKIGVARVQGWEPRCPSAHAVAFRDIWHSKSKPDIANVGVPYSCIDPTSMTFCNSNETENVPALATCPLLT
jgi:hypothetical protein